MKNLELLILKLIIISLLYFGTSYPIFSNPTVFHSQYFKIGYQTPGIRTIPCVTSSVQENIIRTAVAFTEYSKPINAVFRIELEVSYATSPTTNFDLKLSLFNPAAGMTIGVFIVIIKQQTTTKFIDLANFKWGTESPLNAYSPSIESEAKSTDLTINTIFTSIPSGLVTIPFVTSWKIWAPFNVTQNFYDFYVPIEFEITPNIIGNDLEVSLTVSSNNKVEEFKTFIMLLNPAAITWANTNGMNMGYMTLFYEVGPELTLNTVDALKYGPGFDSKCILGFYNYRFEGKDNFTYSLLTSSLGNYTSYKEVKGATCTQKGIFFCFGNGTGCSEESTHLDPINNLCYIATTCPLRVFTGWTVPDKCPSCIQLICEICDKETRSKCSKCILNSNSHLEGNKCVCDINYVPILTPIDKASQGLWNNNAQSLSECKLNCSAVLIGCELYDCINSTFCNICKTGYFVNAISPTNQDCRTCRSEISNCTECSSSTICTNCDSFYGVDSSGKCTLCDLLVMPGCELCEDSSSCLQCVSEAEMVNNVCIFCNENTPHCIDCELIATSSLECTKCEAGYYLFTDPTNPSLKSCKNCQNVCNYCKNCESETKCVECLSPYLIGNTGICDKCISGYQYMGGFCMKESGCTNTVVTSNGNKICLGCASSLHFVLNEISKKCVCDVGYESFKEPASLLESCKPICGDGIFLFGQEECDDKNTENDDGCSMNCKLERGFSCSPGSPTKCVLLVKITAFEFNHVSRVVPENMAVLSFKIEPQVKGFEKLDWKKLLTLKFASESAVDIESLSFDYSSSKNELLITFPYFEELEGSILQTTFEMDSSIIISEGQSKFSIASILKGKNAPLLFESSESQSTSENLNLISTIISIILLIQFYLGSYTHKMIGLETIQIIQTIYFARMIVTLSSSSLLQSLNSIQFSATGYQNGELMFVNSYENAKNQGLNELKAEFIAIGMEKYFLMNVNFTLIPVLFAIILFFVRLKQKIRQRKEFLETEEQEAKEVFVEKRRSCQWVYDHFMFPFIMMLNMVSFFFSILCYTSETKDQNFTNDFLSAFSFSLHLLTLFGMIGIFINELFISFETHLISKMSSKERQQRNLSRTEKLEEDRKNPDRPNYHHFYVVAHCVYYLILEVTLTICILFEELTFKLELTIGIALIYLFVIVLWRPYFESANFHNKFLIFNHVSLLIFLAICEIFTKVSNLPAIFYLVSMYLILALISLVTIGGFIRIFLENSFRKSLEKKDRSNSYKDTIDEVSGDNKNKLTEQKKKELLEKNPYLFNNQLMVLSKQYGAVGGYQELANKANQNSLSVEEELYIIEKLREEYRQRNQQNIIEEILQNEQVQLKNHETDLSPQKGIENIFFFGNGEVERFEPDEEEEGEKYDKKLSEEPETTRNDNKFMENEESKRLKDIKAKLRAELKESFFE